LGNRVVTHAEALIRSEDRVIILWLPNPMKPLRLPVSTSKASPGSLESRSEVWIEPMPWGCCPART
jgi:hypothetical protein